MEDYQKIMEIWKECMQGAKTSKLMLPCGRRVHLHKSASSKAIFEQLLTNHENDAKIDSKMTEKSI